MMRSLIRITLHQLRLGVDEKFCHLSSIRDVNQHLGNQARVKGKDLFTQHSIGTTEVADMIHVSQHASKS